MIDLKLGRLARTSLSKKPIYALLIVSSLALASGCSESPEYMESSADMEAAEVAEEAVVADMSALDELEATAAEEQALAVENLSGNNEQTLGSQAADIKIAGKKLLITANADFKVKDVVKSSNAIESLTRQQGGYVALNHISNHPRNSRTFVQEDKNITLTTYYRQAKMAVRIPRTNVNEFLDQVQQQVAFLNEHQFSAQDVTLDIYREQLANQLNSDMAEELSQERLNSQNNKDQRSNVDAITATYAARRQQELAKLEQMDIEDKVKYSTITLIFGQPDISYKEVTQNLDILVEAERPSFSMQVAQAFKEGWEMLRAVAIGIIQLWWLVVLGAVFYLIYRILRSLYRKFFKNTPRMKKLKHELMGEESNHQAARDQQIEEDQP